MKNGHEQVRLQVETLHGSVFICYAHKDNVSENPRERWLDRFEEFVQPLIRQQTLDVWSDKDIEIGDQWHEKIQEVLQRVRAVVLLVSPAFLESDYIANNELPALLKKAQEDGVRILQIIISPCLYEETKFKYPDPKAGPHEFTLSSFQAANKPTKTLIEMTEAEQNRVLLEVARTLKTLLAGIGTPAEPTPPPAISEKKEAGILLQPSADWFSPVRRNRWRYKVAAFDLDGTLLRGEGFEFSWQAVWEGLAFGKGIQNQLKREYRRRCESSLSRDDRVEAYQTWCDGACTQFMSRGLTRDMLKKLCESLRLTNNCREALAELRSQGVVIAFISGGIDTFLEDLFPDYPQYVDFVFMNELLFSSSGVLVGVRATPFDFEGKAEALDLVCKRVGCTSAEAVFVGDRFNDEAIMAKADKAIAYLSRDKTVEGVTHTSISQDDLRLIVPHVLVE